MGYIQIPKLIGGGGDEPVIDVREMPQDWEYFKSFSNSDYDVCLLFFKGGSNTFIIDGIVNFTTLTVYGGVDGITPLYKCFWSTTAANRYWATYVNGQWVRNTNQPSTFTTCNFSDAGLDTHTSVFPLTFEELTGKPVVNDPHIGTTELFTVVVNTPEGVTSNNVRFSTNSYAPGGTSTSAPYTYPLVAYYGESRGIKSGTSVRTPDLEFVEFTDGSFNMYENELYQCFYLGKVTIPNIVTDITLGSTFSNCPALQEVEFGTGITQTGNNTCINCYNLKKVTFKGEVTAIGNYAFSTTPLLTTLTLPNTTESLGNNCFQNSGIKKINFPSSLTSLGEYCFASTQLEKVILPDTLTNIGNYAFQSCDKLTSIHLPTSLTTLSTYVFSNCYILENFNLPSGLTSIGNYAFQNCYLIKNITLPNTLTIVGNYAFQNCHSLQEITIPTGCELGIYTFYGCNSLKRINLPNDLPEIPQACFYQCRAVEEYDLPSSITAIGSQAFANNSNVKKLVIPSGVTTIAANAFNAMGACRYIKMLGDPPVLANANAFGAGNTYVKILIPYEYINDYKTGTNWSSTTNSIKAKQRGFKTFTQGETLPSTDLTGTYTLKWYRNLDDILATTAAGTPTVSPITVAPYSGEFYCTIV